MAKELTVEERVSRGVKWLDKHGPEDWREKVTIDDLDMGSACRCILGQVFAKTDKYYEDGDVWKTGFDAVCDKGYEGKSGYKSVALYPCRYGFDATGNLEDYEALAGEWSRILGRN